MENHYDGIAGKVREELALDELEGMEEEEEEFNDRSIATTTMTIVKHILECAKELEDIGFNLEDMDY